VSASVDLPVKWVRAPLSALADINQRHFCSLPSASEQPVHFIPMSAVSAEFRGIDVTQRRALRDVEKGYTSCVPNDVLLAKITPCMENGKLAVVPALENHIAFGSTEFHVLSAKDSVHPKWLAYFMSQSSFRRRARQNMTGSAGQMRVPSTWLSEATIPVAPATEQARIVARLEELLSELDAGVAELKAAQKKLARYRQSLLKAAVEGSLTAEWRQQHSPTETGAQLLNRILVKRRARWEAKQLAKFKEHGKAPPKDWETKYVEPVEPDTSNLPDLPNGWVWASVDQLSIEQKYGSSSKTTEDDSGVPVLRMGNIQDGQLDVSSLKYLPGDHDEFPGLLLEAGDLLFNRTNSPELVGKSAIFRSQISPCSFASYLICVRFCETYESEIASTYINSVYGKHWIKSVVVQQVGQANVNGSKLSALAVPLPPREEQTELVSALQNQTREIANQLMMIGTSVALATAQRQNILRAAFAGQLVPQDSNDEPASVLLERIRTQRAAAEQSTKPRKARATKAKV